jgi:hypothetical protein
MTETTIPELNLQEKTESILRQRFEKVPGPRKRLLWWDAGGYLKPFVEAACDERNYTFVAQDHPLAFRQWVADQGETPDSEPTHAVWYVPEAKHGRDWFRDVEAMGDVVEMNIEELTADLYGIQAWQLRPWDTDTLVSAEVATILKDKLSGKSKPRLGSLQGQILTKGNSEPAEHILREGWKNLPKDDDGVDTIRKLLEAEQVSDLQPGDDPQTIIDKVRRWAVAGWLHGAGVPAEDFPSSFSSIHLDRAHQRLKNVLRTDRQSQVLPTYQKRYWDEVVDKVNDPWSLANCPVDGALEHRLWEVWLKDFDDGHHADCAERAHTRCKVLCKATDRTAENLDKESPPWIRAWQQAASLARLARRYATWNERNVPVHQLYADPKEGSWHIDAAVRQIIVSGTPEDGLPEGHPARDALADYRETLVKGQYLQYLRRLAKEMEQALASGQILDEDFRSVTTFWKDHDEELEAGNEAIIFYLDALRLDLARELKEQLEALSDADEEVDFSITESTRMGTLPSETKFGMGAVLPGKSPYKVRIDDSGELHAYRSGSKLSTKKRYSLLGDEGWTIAPKNPSAWTNPLVAYFDTELDAIGENNLNRIEQKLAQRVQELARLVFEKMRQSDCSRGYVVTDHGFVLLPEQTGFQALDAPEGDIERRRVAAEELPGDEQHGVQVSRETIADLSYLETPVRLLVDPQQRYRKQGISDARYYHGGALPQECILSFLEIRAS